MPHASFISYTKLAVALVVSLAPAAFAQSANEVLDASRQAIAEISGFEAQFRMQGEGGSMFAETMPSMSGKLFFGTHSELGKVIHAIGENKDKQADPSSPMDILIANDRNIWVDRAKQEITEAPRRANSRGTPQALTLVLIDTILNDDPYAQDANNAQAISLDSQVEVRGELCDRVVIKRAKPSGGARNSATSYTDAVWYISAKDKLPRKVDRITDAGMMKITLSFEMSNLTIAQPDQARLDVSRPASFKLISRMPGATPEPEPGQPKMKDPIEKPQGNTTPTPDNQSTRAPSFSFKTSDGAVITNSSQIDRVSVLYFWGSWCAPCTQTSPMIESLVTESDNPALDVFALAIREGNPEQALSGFQKDQPTPRVSINPDGVTNAFKIRVFPSIVVIDRAGSIVFQRGIERGFSPEALVEAAQEAMNSALGDS